MSETFPPAPAEEYLPPAGSLATAPLPVAPEEEPSSSDVAKDQLGNVGQGAAQAGQHVAGVAKDQATQVAAEAGRQLKDVVSQAQEQLSEQAGEQQRKLVGGLQSLRDELQSMAQNADHPGIGSDLVGQAADRTGSVAGWLDGREPAALLEDVTAFARRRPGAFLAIAGGIGLLAGRLTRGLKAQSDAPTAESGSGSPAVTSPPATPYPGFDATASTPPATAVGLEEPLPAPIVPSFPTPGYLGDAR